MNDTRLTSLEQRLGARFYWLCQSEGFRVDTPEGRFGLVEAVMFRVRPDQPDALVVRAGVLGRRLVIVPVEDVADVTPRRERIALSRVPDAGCGDLLTEVRARLRRLAAEGSPRAAGFRLAPSPERG
ncbi:MAG: hypothetical protein IT201_00795 [Thermoleophilia bacterium]|nr:hypothetical protein [Thermoleophilia bacterium]